MTPAEVGWRFAPTWGGLEQGNNPGQQQFAKDALTKMVRETLQNSLDHHEDGLGPVNMTYSQVQLDANDFGGDDLAEHIRNAASEESCRADPATGRLYQEMVQESARNPLNCLAVIDSNTTGLQGKNWDNLIFTEGIPTRAVKQTKGGAYGFGKHAPFNLSALNTVLYSTRYISRAAQGRVERMAGRSQLMTHDNPQRAGQRLQSVGFYGVHREDDHGNPKTEPLEGREIPEVFHLQETGTAIFILGFDPNRFPNWEAQIARSVLTQFFAAIHWGNLTVMIKGTSGRERTLNEHTLHLEMEGLEDSENAGHYLNALGETPEATNPSGRLGGMKQLQMHISTRRDAPKRLVHINRRGMVITDSRQAQDNPLYPRDNSGWSPWCAVTKAADEETERFLRRLEPPAHDAINITQLRTNEDQAEARAELGHHRSQIREILKTRIDQDNLRSVDNITELARILPRISASDSLQGLRVTEHQFREVPGESDQAESGPATDNDEGDAPNDSPTPPDRRDGGSNANGSGNGRNGPRDREPGNGRANLPVFRIMKVSSNRLAMNFPMPPNQNRIRFKLTAAGEQYQRIEEIISLTDATNQGDMLARVTLAGNEVTVRAPERSDVNLGLTLSEEDRRYRSYRVEVREEGEGA